MKKIFQTLFPYALYLHIFQLERYDISRALPWVFSHFWQRTTQNKKPLVYTDKAKTIGKISTALAVLGLSIGTIFFNIFVGMFVVFFVLVQPYILIILSLYILKPYEIWNRARTIRTTRQKIRSFKKVRVIGIAGSYGKTSVKDILYHLLSAKYKVLKTPLSYNTIFGIAQVVDLELDDSYDFFICEMGEFQLGDIVEMCEMVLPSYGIITGINDQHLERFKKIENTVSTVFELFDYLKSNNQKTVVNFANDYIKNEVGKREVANQVTSYGISGSDASALHVSFTDGGTVFELDIKNSEQNITTPLLGNAQVNNILGASLVAYELGVPLETIAEKLKTVPSVPHRFEQTLLANGYLLVDNSYSSNSNSFREALLILKGLKRKNKILITPGLVELGEKSNSIHLELGRLTADCTKVVLVGNSERTRALAEGAGPEKVVYLDEIKNLWGTISQFNFDPMDTVALLENDLPDNY